MSKIYIFLDVDGVLNTKNDWKNMFSLRNECITSFNNYLEKLSEANDVKIVLSSSWKKGFSYNGSHAAHIKKLMQSVHGNIIAKTEDFDILNRSREINDFIITHNLTDEKIIIIDDDKTLFPDKIAGNNVKFIYTDAQKGFTDKKETPKGIFSSLKKMINF
jgi:hypothetical protein